MQLSTAGKALGHASVIGPFFFAASTPSSSACLGREHYLGEVMASRFAQRKFQKELAALLERSPS